MNKKKLTKETLRKRRHARVRSTISGTTARPRLNVSKSLTHIFAQLIDDTKGVTIVSVNTKKDATKGDAGERKGKVAASYLLGLAMAEKAKAAGVSVVVFDRGGYRYHGRIQAFADGAREGGLEF